MSSGARIWNKMVWPQNLCCGPLHKVASSSDIEVLLDAEARLVSETDKVPVLREPIFQCELILNVHESMSLNKTGYALLLLLFTMAVSL